MHALYTDDYNQFLLSIEAFGVNFESPYTLSSGLKIPFYCDNRLIFSHYNVYEYAVHALKDMIPNYFPEIDVIAPVSTAGMLHGGMLGYLLMKPLVYIRSEAKSYGKKKQIEGVFQRGQKVLIVEDLVFTGEASLRAVKAVRDAGGEVVGVLSLFSYHLITALETFKEQNVALCSLTNFVSFIETAEVSGRITSGQKTELLEWHKNPYEWVAPQPV